MRNLSINISTEFSSSNSAMAQVAESLAATRVKNYSADFDETISEMAGEEVADLVKDIDIKLARLRTLTLRNPKFTRQSLESALKTLGLSDGTGTLRNSVLEELVG